MSKSVVPNRIQETDGKPRFRGTYSSHKLAATYNALILQSILVLFVCVTSLLIVEVVFLGLKYDIPETSDRRDDHQQDAEYDAYLKPRTAIVNGGLALPPLNERSYVRTQLINHDRLNLRGFLMASHIMHGSLKNEIKRRVSE